jgi:hypothetical protein
MELPDMNNKNIILIMVILIAAFSAIASLAGILSDHGPGEYEYRSIRGENVTIYGRGYYQHMSSDVAIQGIAQDHVTLFIGIPLLLLAFFFASKDSLKGKFVLAGTLGYFAVTYIFYLCMAMYNQLFLLWVLLASLSFYSFVLVVSEFGFKKLKEDFNEKTPVRLVGGFLIFNSIMIGLLWLGVVGPPLLDGSIYPTQVQHYTTLIVQGLDLAILLPASFIAGLLFYKKQSLGYLLAPTYMVFLSILMTSLSAKIIGMSLTDVNPGPAIVIIPLINGIAIFLTIITLSNINEKR